MTNRPPATVSSWIAVCLALVAWAIPFPYTTGGSVLASIGWLLLAAALVTSAPRGLTTGAGGLLIAVFAAGASGAPPWLVLVGTTTVVLSWDAGHNAIGLGRQLGSAASTTGAELRHLAASSTVGGAIVFVGIGVSRLAAGGEPLAGIVLLLLGAGLLVVVLGPEDALDVRFPDE